MNDCEQTQRLGAYHDGELPGPARAALEDHLRQCPACAAELARLRRLSRLLSAVPQPGLPPQVLARLHRAADIQPLAALWRMARAATAVAASILLGCSIWLWAAPSTAESAGQIPLWETVAVTRQSAASAGSEEQLARWIVQDLSRENGHD